MAVADFGGSHRAKISDFLLGSEYIGKTGIFRQGLAVRHTEPHATRFKYILRKLL
jgi:hypothetical protein